MSAGLLALGVLGSSARAEPPRPAYVRVSSGVIAEHAGAGGAVGLESVTSARIRADLGAQRWGQFRFSGRLGYRLLDKGGLPGGALDRTRFRELVVELWPDASTSIWLGRFTPEGGGFRLVDGGRWTRELGENWRIGVWGGLVPDPFTTAPALRFGGGPSLHFDSERIHLDLLGEVVAVPAGLDRLSTVAEVQLEPVSTVSLSGRADVAYGDPARPVQPIDLRGSVRMRPGERVLLDAGYHAWSAAALLRTTDQDPAIERFVARTEGLDLAEPIALDTTLRHQLSASARLRTRAEEPRVWRLAVAYRPGAVADRYASATVAWTAPAGSWAPFGVTLAQRGISWGGAVSSYTSVQADWEPLERFALDGSLGVGVKARSAGKKSAATFYGDLFTDLYGLGAFSVSTGYAFTSTRDVGIWSTSHSLNLRLTWRP